MNAGDSETVRYFADEENEGRVHSGEHEVHAAGSSGERKVAGKAGECVGAGSMKGAKWRRRERIGRE